MMNNQLSLLTSRRFLPLFIAHFSSLFVDSSFKFTLITWVTLVLLASDAAHASLWVNLIGGLYALPALLFSATAGKMADKFDCIHLIRWVKLVEVILLILGGLGFLIYNLNLLAIVIFLLGVHAAVFSPVKYSILPALLKPNELMGGNGLIMAGACCGILIGSAMGVHFGGNEEGVMIVCIIGTILAVFGLGCSFIIPYVPLANPSTKLRWNFLAEILPIVRLTMKDKTAAFAILAIAWMVFVLIGIIRQLPVFSKIVGGDQRLIVLLLGTCLLGVVTGALFCNRLLKGKVHPKYLPFILGGMALCMLDLSYTTFPLTSRIIAGLHPAAEFLSLAAGKRVCLDLFFLCLFTGFYVVPLYTLLQLATPPDKRGQAFACNNIFLSLAGTLSAIVIVGVVKLHFAAPHIFLMMGLLSMMVTPWVWKHGPS